MVKLQTDNLVRVNVSLYDITKGRINFYFCWEETEKSGEIVSGERKR